MESRSILPVCFSIEEPKLRSISLYTMDVVRTQEDLVTWCQAPLRFALLCDDGAVIERAREVFQYWNDGASDETPSVEKLPVVSSRIRTTPDGFEFKASQTDFPLATYRTMANVIRAVETDAAFAIVNHTDFFLTVHGALLARGENAILIVGPSQSGKSTTACALWAAGWRLLSDDVTLLNTAETTARPLMRRVSLRHPSRELLGDDFWDRMLSAKSCDETTEGYVFHPDELEGVTRAHSANLRAVIFLNRLGAPHAAAGVLTPVAKVQALLSLSPYTNVIRHHDLGEAMARLGPLVNAIPCYDLTRAPLPDMIKVLESCICEEASNECVVL